MKKKNLNFILLCIAAILIECTSEKRVVYPDAKRDPTYKLHGIPVNDHYRWLETNSSETRKFIDDENDLSQKFLEKNGIRNKVKDKLVRFWNSTKYEAGVRYGKYYFSFKNTGLQNHNVLYKQIDVTKDPVDVVLDPNKLSADGSIALGIHSFSEDGSLLAYGTTKKGKQWNVLKIRNVETLEDYSEELHYVRYSKISWHHEHKGFFYSRYPEEALETEKLENHTIYYHRVNTSQSEDVQIFTHLNLIWRSYTHISNDGNYLLLSFRHNSEKTAFSIAELPKSDEIESGKIKFKTIVSHLSALYEYVANTGSEFIYLTDENAPNGRLVKFDFNTFIESKTKFSIFFAEHESRFLEKANAYDKNKLVLHYSGTPNTFEIRYISDASFICNVPMLGFYIVKLNVAYKHSEIFFSAHNVLPPEIVYYYKFNESRLLEKPTELQKYKVEGFDSSKYTLHAISYYTRNGKDFPIDIIKRTESKGPKPCLIIGYGGFGLVNTPKFSPYLAYFLMEFDGMIAWPAIRGEEVYSDSHENGRNMKKQKSFDDFQDAAKYLVKMGYTEHEKIVIRGASHGGLLVASCINQAPELFGCAIPEVGVMDMIRFPEFGIGHAFTREFGNPITNQTEFKNNLQYSPLHTVHEPTNSTNQFPPTLIMAGDKDDQVPMLHSLKYAAELQHTIKDNKFQTNPTLLRVYKDVGHGRGIKVMQSIEIATDMLTFMHQTIYAEMGLTSSMSKC